MVAAAVLVGTEGDGRGDGVAVLEGAGACRNTRRRPDQFHQLLHCTRSFLVNFRAAEAEDLPFSPLSDHCC